MIKYIITTTSTSGNNASIKVEKFVDDVLDSTTNMHYSQYVNTWRDFDGLIKIGYAVVQSTSWTCEIEGNIVGYSVGDRISWSYQYQQNLTLEEDSLARSKFLLIDDSDNIWKVVNSALVQVSGTLNAQLFQDNGMDNIPLWEDYSTLSNPSVLCWNSAEAVSMTATTEGEPTYPQTVVSEQITLTDQTTTGIESITATCTGSPLFAVSVNGTDWYMWSGSQWQQLSDATTGMTASVMADITTGQWTDLIDGASYIQIRFTLFATTDTVTEVYLDYTN